MSVVDLDKGHGQKKFKRLKVQVARRVTLESIRRLSTNEPIFSPDEISLYLVIAGEGKKEGI